MNKYIERLTKEWLQHNKIIIAVDYDNTISPYHTFDNKEDMDRCIELLKKASYTGAYIVIFTACNSDRYKDIESYCETIDLKIDSINQNPIELPYGNENKIYANIFIDDRAGFNEAMTILENSMYNVRGTKENNKNLTEIG